MILSLIDNDDDDDCVGSLVYPKLYVATRKATSKPISICEAIASASVEMAIDIQAKLIVALTDSGYTAKCIAKYRPEARVLAVTATSSVARQLSGVSRYDLSKRIDIYVDMYHEKSVGRSHVCSFSWDKTSNDEYPQAASWGFIS